jgi:hypothetical protein
MAALPRPGRVRLRTDSGSCRRLTGQVQSLTPKTTRGAPAARAPAARSARPHAPHSARGRTPYVIITSHPSTDGRWGHFKRPAWGHRKRPLRRAAAASRRSGVDSMRSPNVRNSSIAGANQNVIETGASRRKEQRVGSPRRGLFRPGGRRSMGVGGRAESAWTGSGAGRAPRDGRHPTGRAARGRQRQPAGESSGPRSAGPTRGPRRRP